jgi:hypothetical protein
MLYALALLLFWLSYLQFKEIHTSGYLRVKPGYILSDWTIYGTAAFPALAALIAIWATIKKDKTKGE